MRRGVTAVICAQRERASVRVSLLHTSSVPGELDRVLQMLFCYTEQTPSTVRRVSNAGDGKGAVRRTGVSSGTT